MSTLRERLLNNSTLEYTDVLSKSRVLNNIDEVPTQVPMINVALSGRVDGGLTSGLTVFAGPSKHFKTLFALLLAKSYLDKYDDAMLLFYDSEFGSKPAYFENYGIDVSRVVHSPITDIEQLKHDVVTQLDGIKRGDRVIVVIDSVGNLASKKELDDARDNKSVADMTRAKQLKSLFRMVTPILTLKDIPMVVINHTYATLEIYSKQVVSGGTGVMYSANSVFIIGRQQEKEDTEVVGYTFVINIEKSRFAREKSKIPVLVTQKNGINRWSGLLDAALESGHVIKPKKGWYAKASNPEKNLREKDTNTKEFWADLLADPTFTDWIAQKYSNNTSGLLQNEVELDEELRDVSFLEALDD
jgi:RecA/RadA recombinase